MINTLFKLFSNRKEQLNLQEKHDVKLVELFNYCPCTIFKLIINERIINRKQTNKENKDIFELYDNIQKNIKNNDIYQIELNKILQNKNICYNLELFILKYKI